MILSKLTKDDGYTALHIAAEQDDLECAALLVDAGSYLDHPHPVGWTAAHIACK
jgi:ankyrin repeat protein